MSGTLGALRLIERTSAHLCQSLNHSLSRLNQALSGQVEADPAVSNAADALTRQLGLWQAAWGGTDQPVPLHRVSALTHALPRKIEIDVSALPPATVFHPNAGRILLNIMLLAAESLPKGGHVVVAGTADDLFIKIDGPAAEWPPGMAMCLANETEAQSALVEGRHPQMALTALCAHALGIRLSALHPPATQNSPAILRLGG